MTWADDPQNNFRRESDTTPTYEPNQSIEYQSDVGAVVASSQIDNNQQQLQHQQVYQYENESYATEANAPIQYSISDDTNAELQPVAGGDQNQDYYYGDGNYAEPPSVASAAAVDPATGVYYDPNQYYYDDAQNPQPQPQKQQYSIDDAQQVKQEFRFRKKK